MMRWISNGHYGLLAREARNVQLCLAHALLNTADARHYRASASILRLETQLITQTQAITAFTGTKEVFYTHAPLSCRHPHGPDH
ncbi:hypothetical protein SAMN05660380_02029 [Xylella fastidiosa]|nr:hypothetical protein XFEB_01456 [Xylella fastidiosa EB92.1]SHH05885.1 hypothetical protein SAMN05660380_02029 [Xylella fastidiosa]